MSEEEIVAIQTFSSEVDAEMAQQLLAESGVKAFVFKDDAGGMEPQLQLTGGVRLMINRADAVRAHEILQTLDFD